jgi:hypothetical protein
LAQEKRNEIQKAGKNGLRKSFINSSIIRSLIRMIKPKRMRWKGHVTRKGEKEWV